MILPPSFTIFACGPYYFWYPEFPPFTEDRMTDPLANAFPGDANKGDMESIQKLKSAYDTLKKEMHRVIVGQEAIDQLDYGHALRPSHHDVRPIPQCWDSIANRGRAFARRQQGVVVLSIANGDRIVS